MGEKACLYVLFGAHSGLTSSIHVPLLLPSDFHVSTFFTLEMCHLNLFYRSHMQFLNFIFFIKFMLAYFVHFKFLLQELWYSSTLDTGAL